MSVRLLCMQSSHGLDRRYTLRELLVDVSSGYLLNIVWYGL